MFPFFNVVNINTWHHIPFFILFAVIYRLCNRLHLSIIWGYTKLRSCEHLAVSAHQKSCCSMSGKLHLHSCSALQCTDMERDISLCPRKEYFIIYNWYIWIFVFENRVLWFFMCGLWHTLQQHYHALLPWELPL